MARIADAIVARRSDLLRDLFATAIEKCRAIIEEKNPGLTNKDETAEAVGVGAVIFYYLYGNRVRDINFVMDDALDFNEVLEIPEGVEKVKIKKKKRKTNFKFFKIIFINIH